MKSTKRFPRTHTFTNVYHIESAGLSLYTSRHLDILLNTWLGRTLAINTTFATGAAVYMLLRGENVSDCSAHGGNMCSVFDEPGYTRFISRYHELIQKLACDDEGEGAALATTTTTAVDVSSFSAATVPCPIMHPTIDEYTNFMHHMHNVVDALQRDMDAIRAYMAHPNPPAILRRKVVRDRFYHGVSDRKPRGERWR